MTTFTDHELVLMLTEDKCQTAWELGFIAAMRGKLKFKGRDFDLSRKQRALVRDILFCPNRAHVSRKRKQEAEKRSAEQARRRALDAKLEASRLERVLSENYY